MRSDSIGAVIHGIPKDGWQFNVQTIDNLVARPIAGLELDNQRRSANKKAWEKYED